MVLIEYAHRLFDLWFDKTGSPYYTSDEKDIFINRGLYSFINKHFNESPSQLMERTIRDSDDLSELIVPVTTTTNVNGEIVYSDLSVAMNGREILHILNASRAGTKDCKDIMRMARYVRHNDYLAQKDNPFKQPTDRWPIHLDFRDYIKFYPVGETNVEMVVLLVPLQASLDDSGDTGQRGPNAVDLEISESVVTEVIYLALKHAGVSVREVDFYQLAASQERMDE